MSNQPKILAIASPGGHWIQLNKICNPLDNRFNILYVTPNSQFISNKNNRIIKNIIDASADSKLNVLILALQLIILFVKERPKFIISTGAAPGAIAFLIAKYLPIKTIWIDSIANVKQLSRSGKIVRNSADVILTQWESLSDEKVMYKGSLL